MPPPPSGFFGGVPWALLRVGFGFGSVFRNGRAGRGLIGGLRLLVLALGLVGGRGKVAALEFGDDL